MLYSIDFRLTYRIALYCDLSVSCMPGLGTNATETRADLPLFCTNASSSRSGYWLNCLKLLGWRINLLYSIDFRLTCRIALYCNLSISFKPGLGTNATGTRAGLPFFSASASSSRSGYWPVSYTHLTLPTIYSV